MQTVHLPAFYLGVAEELAKQASMPAMAPMPTNENILPNISSQARWKYVRTKDGLKFSDGNLVYGFGGFPEQLPSEDSRVSRAEDDNILNFEDGALSKGTAQIHRASPDNMYVTLADGGQNPTFMLQHEEGKNWRYSPSKKFIEKIKALTPEAVHGHSDVHEEAEVPITDATLLDADSLFAGMEHHKKAAFNPMTGQGHGMDADELAAKIESLGTGAQQLGRDVVGFGAEHPIATFAGGYLGIRAIQKLRDMMQPDRVREREENHNAHAVHKLMPIVGGSTPVLASMMHEAP